MNQVWHERPAEWRRRSTPRRQRRGGRRVPVILQMSAVECGAACLAMILSYHGRPTRVAEARQHLDSGRDGVTAQHLAQAARAYGLRVKAYALTECATLAQLPLPAIAFWQFRHFVVLERWTPTQVAIVDPAVGRQVLSAAEFAADFTGVVLICEPGVQFARQGTSPAPAWRQFMWLHLRQARGIGGQILGASLLLQGLGLAAPLFTQLLVDTILPQHLTNLVLILLIGFGLWSLAQALSGYLRAALLIYLQARLDTQMMVGFFEHLLSLPFRFFQQRSNGDLLLRLESISLIREVLTGQLLSLLLDGVLVGGYLVVLLLAAPIFAALAVGLGLLQIGLMLGSARRLRRLTEQTLQTQADAAGYLVQALVGIETLKALGAEGRALERWANLFYAQLNVRVRRNHLTALVDTAMTVLRAGSPLLLLLVGAGQVLDGTLSLGTMLALNTLAASFLAPLSAVVASGQQLQLVGAQVARIADVLEAAPEQAPGAGAVPPRLSGEIRLEGVSFRYSAATPEVVRGISLRIAPGQKVALVGRSGSGKSTLARLLLGLYIPTEGSVWYDGRRLEELNYQAVRTQCGIVLQEAALFGGSIRENISLSDPGLGLEAVREAARRAGIAEEIEAMPMGYETRLAEDGSGISGGQRQRIALARALAHEPAILLLDEATSHLDALTEQRVEEQLSALQCTRLVIAHRLSTVRNADLIVVLEDGEIVEQGTHESLLARQGIYAALIHTQQT